MGFALFLLYLVVTFVRPGEQIPSLQGWELMDITSALALLTGTVAFVAGRGPSLRAPQISLALAFWAWALVSVLGSPASAGGLQAVLAFGKSSGTAFLLAILNVDTTRRLRIVAVALTLLSLFVVGQAALTQRQVHTAADQTPDSGYGGLWGDASDDRVGPPVTGGLKRIRSFGFLADPNDLACTLVAILPLSIALRRSSAPFRNTLMVWLPVGVMVYGIYLTRSRGGILAFAGVLGLLVRRRLGGLLSILTAAGALLALLALGFLGGRSLEIDRSAEGRIEAWSAGLQMLKTAPVSGVGYGMFTQNHERAAHNSFVHCFGELGFVGYSLWLTLIMLTLDDLRLLARERGEDEDLVELRGWGRPVGLSLVGFLLGGLFLSRPYDVVLFLLLGLGAGAADMARRRGLLKQRRDLVTWTCFVIAVEVASIILFWLYMRLLR
jgi:O-antigen ligase